MVHGEYTRVTYAQKLAHLDNFSITASASCCSLVTKRSVLFFIWKVFPYTTVDLRRSEEWCFPSWMLEVLRQRPSK